MELFADWTYMEWLGCVLTVLVIAVVLTVSNVLD